jgi:hypothetical protein
MQSSRIWQTAAALFVGSLSLPVSTYSDETAVPVGEAKELVKQALQAELRGDSASRGILLDGALLADPEYAPARWHAGQVRVNDKWMTLSQAEEHFRNDDGLAAYRAKRDRASDTAAAELALARWCRRNNLAEWGTTHSLRVLYGQQSSPQERAEAAKNLQWTLHQGVPVPIADLPKIKKQEREYLAAVVAWSKRITKLTQQFHGKPGAVAEAASSELQAIDDVRAVPALEAIFSPSSQAASRLTLSILANIPEHASTQSLVRHAVLSPWPSVRNTAIDELKSRPLHDYMPYLLGALDTPIQFASNVEAAAVTGEVVRQHIFFREGARQDHAHLAQVSSTPVVSVQQTTIDNVKRSRTRDPSQARRNITTTTEKTYDEREARFIRKVAEEHMRAQALEQRVAAENMRIAQDNARIYQVLEEVAQGKLPQRPVDWWNWWRDYNDVYDHAYESGKPTLVSRESSVDYYLTTVAYRTNLSGEFVRGPYSCFCCRNVGMDRDGPHSHPGDTHRRSCSDPGSRYGSSVVSGSHRVHPASAVRRGARQAH